MIWFRIVPVLLFCAPLSAALPDLPQLPDDSIRLDAHLNDWPVEAPLISLNRLEQVAIGKDRWSADDLSARIRVAYDSTHLYFAAEVSSAWQPVNTQLPSSAWNGDALQVFFSFNGGERGHDEHLEMDQHLVVAARPGGKVWSYSQQRLLPGSRVAFRHHKHGWVMELAVPLSAFPTASIRPGGSYRLDVAVDGSGPGSKTRTLELSLSGRDDSWQSTAAWGRGRLGGHLAMQVPADPSVSRILRRIPYLEGPGVRDKASTERCTLDLHIPNGAQGPLPVLVYFHGGGLTNGKREVPTALREQGVLVLAPSYRFSPSVKAPAYIQDAAAAVAWAFKHAAEHGGDPARIWISGHSAGGYLASMLALDKRYLAAHGIDADRLAGVAPLSGHAITHFTVRKERGIPETQPIIDDLAPLYHVRKDAPPYHIFSGDREKELLGRYEENAYLWRMLKHIGHPAVTLKELKGEDHGSMAQAAMPHLLRLMKADH